MNNKDYSEEDILAIMERIKVLVMELKYISLDHNKEQIININKVNWLDNLKQ